MKDLEIYIEREMRNNVGSRSLQISQNSPNRLIKIVIPTRFL